MFLIAGLGNPGTFYEDHRHNVGFMVIDEVVCYYKFNKFQSRFQSSVSDGTIANKQVIALKPLTFMNNSGLAIYEAAYFFRLSLKKIIIFYDELDLPPGIIQVRTGSWDVGHNGIKSINTCMGGNYHCVRLGIGHPGHSNRVIKYVLQIFNKADYMWLNSLTRAIAEFLPYLLSGNDANFTVRLNFLTCHKESL